MKYEIIEIDRVYSKSNIENKVIKELTEKALFNDSEKLRKAAYNALKSRYKGFIKGGFEKAGVMFLYAQFNDSELKIIDLGLPVYKYKNKSTPFEMENNHK